MDAFGWRRLCTSFQGASDDLCCSLALVARRLCTYKVDPDGIVAMVACRLIALNKCPGVRPIGVGEVMRRIIARAVLSIVKLDVLEAAGSLQLCAGQDAGNEAAVHAMRAVYLNDSTEALLLVDGYYPNAAKTWLIVKPAFFPDAQQVFKGTGVQVTTEGKHHLGAALGSRLFAEQYVSEKIESWSSCIVKLSDIAKVHSHAAYSAFTHGLCNKWTYLLRTIPEISIFLRPLEVVISTKFIPALTGRLINNDERDLLALPVRLDGLGIANPQTISDSEFAASEKVTSPLVTLILQQALSFGSHIIDAQHLAKSEVVSSKRQVEERAASVCDSLPPDLKRIISLSSEKGASSWLSSLPDEEHGFARAFHDALYLRYGWLPSGLPVNCACGQGFSVDHALNCPTGGYPTLRHNELRDFTAEICRKSVVMFVPNPICNHFQGRH